MQTGERGRTDPRRNSGRWLFVWRVGFLSALGLSAGSALADWPITLSTRPDPFERLGSLDAGQIASLWSSLPDTAGCEPGSTTLAGHAQFLAESNALRDDAQVGPFSFLQPRTRLQVDGTGRWGCVFGQLALQRQVGPDGRDQTTWDGSALAWQIDRHWRVSGGRIARQWGPAWDGSLILGTAARPIPSVAVDARTGPLSPDGWWWWLGELDFTAFFGEQDDDRTDINRPYLMGARVVVRPWPWLELGASRTAQWGGEGRDNSLRAFWTAVAGRDNQDGDPSQQPGNQLGGFDLRLDLSKWLGGVGLYGQMIGEDEAASLPAKYMYLAGADWRQPWGMAFVEWTDSMAKVAGVAYNHHIYTDGYRYAGSPMGHWADGDSNLWTVGGLLRDLLGGQALAVLRYGRLNESGINPSWPNARLGQASLQWRMPFERIFGLTFALDHLRLSSQGSDPSRSDTQFRVQLDAWLH